MYIDMKYWTGKKSKVFPKECPECGSKNLIKKKKDVVCKDCGLVMEGEKGLSV